MNESKILIAGCNGFIGQKLLWELLDAGHFVRALVRDPKKLIVEHSNLEVVTANLLESESLINALKGIQTAYYLVHGLSSEENNFEYVEAKCAANFARVAKESKVKKIIFVGALGNTLSESSPHLRSRHLTGEILGLGSVPCLEFRASIVLGAGSTSFEMMKALCERSPVRLSASWLDNLCQPIFIDDLLKYLIAGLSKEIKGHQIVEIGGKQTVTYSTLMDMYLEICNEKRPKLALPSVDKTYVLPLLEVIVPEFFDIGRKLIMSLEHHTIVTDESANNLFPEIDPMDTKLALAECIKASTTSYPAIWEGEFWKALKDQNWLQNLQAKENVAKKLNEYTLELKKLVKFKGLKK